MPYSAKTHYLVKKGPRTLGNSLGRVAVDLDFSVSRIAQATGATRQTVYNWMAGGDVLNPYKPIVERLLVILKTAKDAEAAWSTVCTEFNLST